MPFSIETKTEMFVRSSRLCCLCLKQCGVNIEAAHIVAEAEGGPNDSDNGIPVCFDCHQEIGGYDDAHPKGNKFRPEELKERRNRVYRLVESGIIYAQIIAQRVRSREMPELAPDEPRPPQASAEARRFLDVLKAGKSSRTAGQKLLLLSSEDRAYVLDDLVRSAADSLWALAALAEIVKWKDFSSDEGILLLEQVVRALTFYGKIACKAELLKDIPAAMLAKVYEGVRLAFFADLISIIHQDQFDDVNEVVPAIADHAQSIPPLLYKEYGLALLDQSHSSSWRGAPAAKAAIISLPERIASEVIPAIDAEYLMWNARYEPIREFVRRYRHLAAGPQAQMFDDLLSMSNRDFMNKHLPEGF